MARAQVAARRVVADFCLRSVLLSADSGALEGAKPAPFCSSRRREVLIGDEHAHATKRQQSIRCIGAGAIRLGEATSVTLLNLDDRVVQLDLAQGTPNLGVRRLDHDQLVKVDTPNLASVIRRPGQ
jgi:hypothetical protein